MRFRIELVLDKPELPIEYRRIILSLIKKSLTQANDGMYFEKFFSEAMSKDYTFAVKLPRAVFQKDMIRLEHNNFSITFSTYDKKVGYILYAAFAEQIKKRFPLQNNNCLRIMNIKLLQDREIRGSKILFKTSAPLVVRKHEREGNKDYYYVYSDAEFVDESLKVLKEQLRKAGYQEKQIESLNITPINMKKVVVKHYGCCIPCSLGYVMLEGSQSVLNYLYKTGLASRRSSGFGFIDIIAE